MPSAQRTHGWAVSASTLLQWGPSRLSAPQDCPARLRAGIRCQGCSAPVLTSKAGATFLVASTRALRRGRPLNVPEHASRLGSVHVSTHPGAESNPLSEARGASCTHFVMGILVPSRQSRNKAAVNSLWSRGPGSHSRRCSCHSGRNHVPRWLHRSAAQARERSSFRGFTPSPATGARCSGPGILRGEQCQLVLVLISLMV